MALNNDKAKGIFKGMSTPSLITRRISAEDTGIPVIGDQYYTSLFPLTGLVLPRQKQSPIYAPYISKFLRDPRKKAYIAQKSPLYIAIYPYGEIDILHEAPSPTREKFTGKEFDEEGADIAKGVAGIQAYYFGVRFYDPAIGYWNAPDPAGQFMSGYVYVGGNPILLIDPDGTWSWLPVALGATVGGISGLISDRDNPGSGFIKGAAIGAFGGHHDRHAGGRCGVAPLLCRPDLSAPLGLDWCGDRGRFASGTIAQTPAGG